MSETLNPQELTSNPLKVITRLFTPERGEEEARTWEALSLRFMLKVLKEARKAGLPLLPLVYEKEARMGVSLLTLRFMRKRLG